MKRKIINIDESLCNGCGLCVPSCHEQALQLVDTPNGKKARLVKEIFCDGLGACLGDCPTGALTIEERKADAFDNAATETRIKEIAPELLELHREHMQEHGLLEPEAPAEPPVACGCAGADMFRWDESADSTETTAEPVSAPKKMPSELKQWPVQLHLVSPRAPFFKDAYISFIADCVPMAYANTHRDFIKGKSIVLGCPKFDDVPAYIQKLTEMFKFNTPKEFHIVVMEVPCCLGLSYIVKEAMEHAGKTFPVRETIVSIKGTVKQESVW